MATFTAPGKSLVGRTRKTQTTLVGVVTHQSGTPQIYIPGTQCVFHVFLFWFDLFLWLWFVSVSARPYRSPQCCGLQSMAKTRSIRNEWRHFFPPPQQKKWFQAINEICIYMSRSGALANTLAYNDVIHQSWPTRGASRQYEMSRKKKNNENSSPFFPYKWENIKKYAKWRDDCIRLALTRFRKM